MIAVLMTAVEQIKNCWEIQRSFQWLTLINGTQSQNQSKKIGNVYTRAVLTFISVCYALLILCRKGILDNFQRVRSFVLFAGLIYCWLYKLFSATSMIVSSKNKRLTTHRQANHYLS